MNTLTEKIDIVFINGEKGQVEVKKFVSFPEKQRIISQYTSKGKLKSSGGIELDIDFFGMMPAFLEMVWVDTEHKIEDISSDSIEPYILEKVKNFLPTGAEKK